jgi:hypothetical protein
MPLQLSMKLLTPHHEAFPSLLLPYGSRHCCSTHLPPEIPVNDQFLTYTQRIGQRGGYVAAAHDDLLQLVQAAALQCHPYCLIILAVLTAPGGVNISRHMQVADQKLFMVQHHNLKQNLPLLLGSRWLVTDKLLVKHLI